MKTAHVFAILTATALTFSAGLAAADEDGNGSSGSGSSGSSSSSSSGSGSTSGSASASGSGSGVRASASATKPAAADDDGMTDHERVVGRFAVGYMGASDLPLPVITSVPAVPQGQAPGRAVSTAGTLNAPVIGARYWLTPRFGIDAGLGIGWSAGSTENVAGNTTVSTDKAARFGFILHGGVPIALVSAKHYTFQVVPEFNVGYATTSGRAVIPPGSPNTLTAGPDASASAFRLDIGARAGAEIHFGFIGVPQLALQATVGLYFQTVSTNVKRDTFSDSDSSTGIGTTVQADPWALFTKNISALYYF